MSNWIGLSVDSEKLEHIASPTLDEPLHITLVFISKEYLGLEISNWLVGLVEGLSLSLSAPLPVLLQEPAVFANSAKVVTVSAPMEMVNVRNRLRFAIQQKTSVDRGYSWRPHITLGHGPYNLKTVEPYLGSPITCPEIFVKIGGIVSTIKRSFPLQERM